LRRVSLIPVRPGEGRLTEPILLKKSAARPVLRWVAAAALAGGQVGIDCGAVGASLFRG